jgi:DNA-binding CsgD family transcriptional regulator/PAS domain-containing protein
VRERDIRALAEVSRTLLSPLDAPDLGAWCRDVDAKLARLLGADVMALEFPTSNGLQRHMTSGGPRGAFEGYVDDYLPSLERKWGIRRRLLELAVSSRRTLYGKNLPTYYRTPTWHELIVPNRCFDTIAMATSTGPDLQGPAAYAFLIHQQRSGPKFGLKGLDALRSLFPSFRAAARIISNIEVLRHHEAALVDAIPSAVALANADGQIIHRNPALLALTLPDDGRVALEHAISVALKRTVAHKLTDVRGIGLTEPAPPEIVRVGAEQYRVTASLIAQTGTAGEAHALAIVERFGPAPFPGESLVARGLTVREVDVVRHVVRGETTESIASSLGISRHTARHHLESVMRKLRVHSRAALAAYVAALEAGGTA